jgi:MYXO-CTERM domain-containing protein
VVGDDSGSGEADARNNNGNGGRSGGGSTVRRGGGCSAFGGPADGLALLVPGLLALAARRRRH